MGELKTSTSGGEGRLTLCTIPGGSKVLRRTGGGCGSTFSSTSTSRPKQLPVEEILERVTHPSETDKRAERVLLMCYPSFCERKQLFDILKANYHQPRFGLN